MPERDGRCDLRQNEVFRAWHDELDAGRVTATRCARCSRWQWYPLVACPSCGSTLWSLEEVAAEGVLHSWTRVVRPTVSTPGVEPPYVVGLITIPQAGDARLVALLDPTGSAGAAGHGDDPVIGIAAELLTRTIDGHAVLFFRQ